MAKTKNKPQKNYTLKKINNRYYVYTWSYIKKENRIKDEKRFNWKYRGPLEGDGGKFIEKLEVVDIKTFWAEVHFNEVKDKEFHRITSELYESVQFKDRVAALNAMAANDAKTFVERELVMAINHETKTLIRIMFKGLTHENYQSYLDDGGSIKELRERIEIL